MAVTSVVRLPAIVTMAAPHTSGWAQDRDGVKEKENDKKEEGRKK